MTAAERLEEIGYPDAIVFTNYAYDSALIGVTTDGRAVYSYEKMVDDLMENEGMTYDNAVEWIDYNTIRALPYMGEDAPIVMYNMWE